MVVRSIVDGSVIYEWSMPSAEYYERGFDVHCVADRSVFGSHVTFLTVVCFSE